MPDDHVPTRDVAYFDGDGNQVAAMPDPLIVFYWARLDDVERAARYVLSDYAQHEEAWSVPSTGVLQLGDDLVPTGDGPLAEFIAGNDPQAVLDDIRSKKAILDDYERRCRDTTNPARELECRLIRGVIQQLATVYAGHPDYREDFRP